MNPLPLSRLRRFASLAAVVLALIGFAGTPLLTGCGGSSSSNGAAAQTGRATLTITWPGDADSRLIPAASNSVLVTFSRNGQVVAQQTIARPAGGGTATATFDTLPLGDLTLLVEARPDLDGSGVTQASAATVVTIVANQITPVGITMASTIDHLALTPINATVGVGRTTRLSLAALDASGNMVPLSSSTLVWTPLTPGVATVDSTGLVTGVAEGTAQIQVTETESGKSVTVNVTVTATGAMMIVDLANAYLNSLSINQRSVTVVASNAANAAKWSNLPATPGGTDGTNSLRNGVAYSTLTAAQKAAFDALVQSALGTQGYNRFTQIRAADDYLGTLQSGYSGSYVYVAFVGLPTTTGAWLLQIGGHHIAHNLYFVGNTLQTTTPYFLGVEPRTFTLSGTTYTPLQPQRDAMFNLVNSLSTTQLTTARLSGSFTDVLLGPGKNARSLFPTGTTGRGILASSLSATQKDLLKAAIAAWTGDSARASTYQALYESELDQTYVAYSGTTALTTHGDYVRIDGPHVWIEFVCQNGAVVTGIHYHTIWRDRVSDYNAAFGF